MKHVCAKATIAECHEESFVEMTDIDKNIEDNHIIEPAAQERPKGWITVEVLKKIRGSRISSAIFLFLYTALLSLTSVFSHLATDSAKLRAHYISDSEYYIIFVISLLCTLIFPLLAIAIVDRTPAENEHIISHISNFLPASGAAAAAFAFFYFSTANVFESDSKWAPYISFCAIVSAVFFLLKILSNRLAPNVMAGFKILTAIGVFVFSSLIIVSLYLDYTTELNSHFKLIVQFGAVGVIIGTMADARSILLRISKRSYIIFKMTALTLTITSAISVLTRVTDEITAFAYKQGLTSLTVHDYVHHFSTNPVASASYVIASVFFVSYAACVIIEIVFGIFVRKSKNN